MKKVFLFLVIIFAVSFCASAQSNNDTKISISGFDGNKPLKEDGLIVVIYPDSPDDYYLEPAYKGENKTRFLRRITRHENFAPTKDSRVLPKDSLAGKKIVVVDKNLLPPMRPVVWLLVICLAIGVIIAYLIIRILGTKNKVE